VSSYVKTPNQALERTADRREDFLLMTSTLKTEARLALIRSLRFTFRYPLCLTVYPPASRHGVFVGGRSASSR
jgi:hypothetical protein